MTGQTVILSHPGARQKAHQLIERAPYRAVLNIRPETRSNEASAKMWCLLSDIARAKPMGRTLPAETWKCLFLDDLGHKPKWEPDLDGTGVVNTGYRSSRLTKAQMSDMIERLYAFMSENEIQSSEPNPYEKES